MMKEADKDGKMVYKGYCVDLLDALSELMNFEYEIYESSEGYGMMAPDRSWNGVIKELIDRVSNSNLYRIDLNATPVLNRTPPLRNYAKRKS